MYNLVDKAAAAVRRDIRDAHKPLRCDCCGIRIFDSWLAAVAAGVCYSSWNNLAMYGSLCFSCAVGDILEAAGLREWKYDLATDLEPCLPPAPRGCHGRFVQNNSNGRLMSYSVTHRFADGPCPAHGRQRVVHVKSVDYDAAAARMAEWVGWQADVDELLEGFMAG